MLKKQNTSITWDKQWIKKSGKKMNKIRGNGHNGAKRKTKIQKNNKTKYKK